MTIRQRSPLPRTGSVRAGLLAALLVAVSAAARAAGGFAQCAALDSPVFLVGDGTPSSCTQAALQTALDTAGAMGGGRIMFLCAGTIALSSTLTPRDKTTIDGGGRITLGALRSAESVKVEANTTVVLKNLSVVGPHNADLVATSGMLTVCNCTFSGPPASPLLRGSAIRNSDSGTLIVTNSTFTGLGSPGGNPIAPAIANSGTAIVNGSTVHANGSGSRGIIYNFGTLEVKNSVFFDNLVDPAGLGGGGAILNGGTLTVINSEFIGNRAGRGGAISNGGSLIVENSAFFDNHSIRGGAISSLGLFTVRHSEFLNNGAGFVGGGLDVQLGDATIIDSTVAGNMAGFHGGGLYVGTATVTIDNSTVTLNRAATDGGGICIEPSGSLSLSPSSTVTGNIPDDIANPNSCSSLP